MSATESKQAAARTTRPCVHCSEPTLCSPNEDPADIFCCSGCRAAYQLIKGLGLDQFYALRNQSRQTGWAMPAGRRAGYQAFDDPDFIGPEKLVSRDDGSVETTLAVGGLHCAACSWLIENAMARHPGVLGTRINMADHTISIVFQQSQQPLSRIAEFLDGLGYPLAPLQASSTAHLRDENRRLLVQIAVAGFLAANAMWIAIALYSGALSSGYGYYLQLIGTALGVASVAGPGRVFLKGAWAALTTRTPHMDLPVALGLTVGTVFGIYNAVQAGGDVYFDSLASLVFLLLIGRWIQFRQQQKAAKAVELMMRITPQQATVVDSDGKRRVVRVEAVVKGELVEVASGGAVPIDGLLESTDSASLDCSLLTGESLPSTVLPQQQVYAGVVNVGAPIQLRVTAIGNESRVGKIMKSVEQAAVEKTPIVMLADRIGAWFVVAVTLLSILAFGVGVYEGLAEGVSRATALLIVACPCALALATPLAIAVALGRAARQGLLIRDGSTLQTIARNGKLWFDKTGTLTEGRFQVTAADGDSAQMEKSLVYAAAIERSCRHPIAQAIVKEVELRGLDSSLPAEIEMAGRNGIAGTVAGEHVVVGNRRFLLDHDIPVDAALFAQGDAYAEEGRTPVWIALNGHVTCVLGLSDPIRKEASSIVRSLKGMGWTLGILSGDDDRITKKVGRAIGIDQQNCFGNQTPEDKLDVVRDADKGAVIMVGDGANDAAALAAASVGIAVRGGAEVSLQAAPIFVSHGDLDSLLPLFVGARRTQFLIWTTFAVSLTYNAFAVVLAMLGWISPLVAALLMPASSLSVLLLTLAMPTFPKVQE